MELLSCTRPFGGPCGHRAGVNRSMVRQPPSCREYPLRPALTTRPSPPCLPFPKSESISTCAEVPLSCLFSCGELPTDGRRPGNSLCLSWSFVQPCSPERLLQDTCRKSLSLNANGRRRIHAGLSEQPFRPGASSCLGYLEPQESSSQRPSTSTAEVQGCGLSQEHHRLPRLHVAPGCASAEAFR